MSKPRIKDGKGRMLIPKFVTNFFILIWSSPSLHLIAISSIASQRKLVVRFLRLPFLPLLLLLLLLRTPILKGQISLSLSFCFSGLARAFPPLNLITRLSDRAHEKRIVLPTLPAQLLLADLGCRYPFFSRYTRRCKFLCPPVYPPVQIAENYLASPPRSPTFLDACRSSIFYPAVPLLRKLFFATFSRLISLVTRQATLSSIRTTARGFSVLQ